MRQKFKVIDKMEMVLKYGAMAATITETLSMDQSRLTVFTIGPMVADMKENGYKMKWMVEAVFSGLMDDSISVTLSKVWCTATEDIPGKTAESIKESIGTIRSTEWARISTPMAVSIVVNGKMDNSTARVPLSSQLKKINLNKSAMVFGNREDSYNGRTKALKAKVIFESFR